MASLDQMEGDAIEFGLLILVVLIIAGLILSAEGSFGLLNWVKALLQKISDFIKQVVIGVENKVPGQTFVGHGNGEVQGGKSAGALTNVTDDQAYNSAYMGGTLLGSYLSGTVPIVADYSPDPGSGVGVVSMEGVQ